jgi:hypothetical protein
VTVSVDLAEVLRAMSDGTITASLDCSAAALGRLTGMAYTLKHEAVRERVEKITAKSYAIGEEWLR